ncbi:plasmid stability protein StbB [Pseudoduganella danionis]|uniref:Plasmid stability protein StbB n=1 Tax=Pseudoduganella danionis TaxID=1890295 RepID=A0ABW9SVB1_9BURK|nr:plasmid stability protein StbB [Pseudoduganella danionis]MTW35494.1 plasmid stability protein StbB [Pseudoduganella danionis]
MKVVICSLAGSVGKTTIAAHMLCPRMPKARVSAVDTANVTVKDFGIDCDVYSGEQFSKLYKELLRQPNALIDVGGSKEGKEFLAGMDWMEGHDEIDAFIIPSLSDDKAQKGAFKTIELLLAQGVAKEKIKVIFNGVNKDTEEEFDYLLGALTVTGIPYSLEATIFQHEIFKLLSTLNISLEKILTDKTDYKARFVALPENAPEDELARLSNFVLAQKYAPRVSRDLNKAFDALFPNLAAPALDAKPESKRASAKA